VALNTKNSPEGKFCYEKYYSKEKKKKKKVLYSSGGKMTCNIFLKKI